MNEMKTHVFCTLFNSLYLDKGIVLYKSLERVGKDFTLYVLAMDDKCYDVLTDLRFKSLILIRLSDFENKDLLIAKGNRPFGQYCWTCTSSLIKYILVNCKPDYCTYLDADMVFYDDPNVLIKELEQAGASVSIVGHRFCKYDKKLEKKIGKYCVECNTFKNNEESLVVLNKWISQCIEDCSNKGDGVHWGDQKYMDNWVKDYDFVIESKNKGAGVAPWNLPKYRFCYESNNKITLRSKCTLIPLLFYHFEGITYSPTRKSVNIHVFSRWGIDRNLVYKIYLPYLSDINKCKNLLRSEYGIDFLTKCHSTQTRNRKENFSTKIKRRLKMLLKFEISQIIYHSIPTRLFHNNNVIKITD